MSKLIVIDACVAASASSKETPVSTVCKGLLEEFLKTKNKLVFNKQLKEEWKNHPSIISLKILSSLRSRGRIIEIQDQDGIQQIRDKIIRIRDTQRIEAILKDLHLIEAALFTDKIIISLDKKARNNFVSILNEVNEISDINWLNPVIEPEGILSWLVNGAIYEDKRALKNYSHQPI